MKIAIVAPGFSADSSDWCIPVLLDFVRELASCGHAVTVVALRYPHRRIPYSVAGARVVPLGGADVRGIRRVVFLLRAIKALTAVLRSTRFDVVHAWWAHEPGWLATRAARVAGVPSIVSVCGGELVDLPEIDYGGQGTAINRWLVGRALGRGHTIVVASGFQESLATDLGLDPARIRRIPLGVDSRLFREKEAATPLEGDPALVHVASLIPVKGQVTLLRAFQVILHQLPRARLHLIGEGASRAPLEALGRNLGIDHALRFHGAVPRDELPDRLTSASLHLFSSWSESMPMTVLEAAASGCPTAGTAVGALPDFPQFCATCAVGDSEGLAHIALSILLDPQRRSAMRDAGLRITRDALDIRSCVHQHTALYREVARTA